MNFARVTLPYLGSGSTSRLATTRLLGILASLLSSGYPDTDLPLLRERIAGVQGSGLTWGLRPIHTVLLAVSVRPLLGTLGTVLGATLLAV